jgi:hypothetical protein
MKLRFSSPAFWVSNTWRRVFRTGLRRNKAQMSASFDRLMSMRNELNAGIKGIEKKFLETGEHLESLTRHGMQFVKQASSLARLATGKDCDESVFANAIQLIEGSNAFLVTFRNETIAILEQLRTYNAQIERLLGLDAELRRTMMPLQFVQVLFRSESAPLGPSVQQMFGALTQQIEKLNCQVRDIFGAKFEQLSQIRKIVGNVISRLEAHAASLEEITTTRKAQIEQSLAVLRQEMQSNQQRDAKLEALSAEFARELERVVTGMQFQDIVNQKLQHVGAAFPEIEKRYKDLKAGSGPLIVEALQFLDQSCRLEAEQVQVATDEVANAEKTINSSLKKISSYLTDVDSRCLSLEEFKTLTASFDGIVQVLVETLESIRELVCETSRHAAEIHEMLRPMQSLASDLTTIVRDVSSQIHLIALNAQIQAVAATADNEKAAGLEVLSAQMRMISGETGRISEAAAEQLDSLAGGIAASVGTFEHLRREGHSQETLLNNEGRVEENRLHTFRDNSLQVLRALGDSLDQLTVHTEQAREGIEFSEFYEVTLPAFSEPMLEMAKLAEERLLAEGHEIAQEDLVSEFKGDYTMQSEVDVFKNVMAERKGEKVRTEANDVAPLLWDPDAKSKEKEDGPQLAAAVSGSPAGAAGFGDNVELF